MEQLLSGEAKALYHAAREYRGWTPAEKVARAAELTKSPTKAAQIAANAGNLSGACDILCNSCPVAPFDEAVIAKAEELHPQLGCDGLSTNVKDPVTGIDTTRFNIPDDTILKYFRRMPMGKEEDWTQT